MGVGTTATATISAGGLAHGVAAGTSSISATLGLVSGSTVLTVTAATLSSIAVTPANPLTAAGEPAVRRHRHVLRCNDRRHHRLGHLGLGHNFGHDVSSGGLATGLAAGTSTISATLGLISGSTVLTVTSANDATPPTVTTPVLVPNPAVAGSMVTVTSTGPTRAVSPGEFRLEADPGWR